MKLSELENYIKELDSTVEQVKLIKSNRPDLCDYQYDSCFNLAKKLHKSPMEIGSGLVSKLMENEEMNKKFSKIECVAPGFINFTLTDSFINETLNKMLTQPKFNIELPKKEKIVIDYGGANVAKPLHVGHLRPAIVGEAIKRLLRYMNQDVVSDVHLGDYGLQIGQVIYGLKEKNLLPEDISLEILTDLYPKISALCKENEKIKEKCSLMTKDLQDGNPEYQEYFRKILEISKKDIKKIYDYLGVSFDLWLGESNAYPYIPFVTEELEKEKLLKKSEGAIIVEVQESTDTLEIPPLIYQASNGAYLYSTTDLATIYQREKDFKPDKIIYIADSRQSLHFTQVFRTSKKMEKTKTIDCEFLGLGTINGKDNKPFKTRAGNTPKLIELFNDTKETFIKTNPREEEYKETDLHKLINSIIKFADLQNNREKGYIFDIEKFSAINGKTGPYILYTYLRTQKIIKNNPQFVDNLGKTIYNVHDRALRLKVLELEEVLNYAFKTRMPSIIANYLYEISVLVNAFYENNHINNLENNEKKKDWVTLLSLCTKIIQKLLELLVIEIPDKM